MLKLFGIIENKSAMAASFVLSFLFWIMLTLSEKYSSPVTVKLHYINLPDGKTPIVPLEDKVTIFVSNIKGTELLKYLYLTPKEIEVDYRKNINAPSISTARLLRKYNHRFSFSIDEDNISPETLTFELEKVAHKKIPIELIGDLSTARQFEVRQIKLTPDSLTISGPQSVLDTIRTWQTLAVEHSGISHNLSGSVALRAPTNLFCKLSTNRVDYEVVLEEYTEKDFNIPIEAINVPANTTVFLYPSSVKLTCLVAMNSYNLFDETYFRVIADFDKHDLSQSTITLKIAEKPADLRNVAISPTVAEFILQH